MGKHRFEITLTLLEALENRRFDQNLVASLHDLVGQGFETEFDFLDALQGLSTPPSTDIETATLLRSADRIFQEAVALFEKAYHRHMRGNLPEAIRLYNRSIGIFPTAEAHTFLGWAYSFSNNYSRAIAECEKAILLDVEYGNPYNDIGSYLIAQSRFEEAIPWLEKALSARRYSARHYAWANLGRAHEAIGDRDSALRHFMKALELEPEYDIAKLAIERLCGPAERLN